jgi:hypothetical protein
LPARPRWSGLGDRPWPHVSCRAEAAHSNLGLCGPAIARCAAERRGTTGRGAC